MSSYHCPSPLTRSETPKWEYIFNCCSDCPGMNVPDLESPEQLDCLFTD